MRNIKILLGVGFLLSCLNYSSNRFEGTDGYFYEKPNITQHELNTNFDTGYFYQTKPMAGKKQIDENFLTTSTNNTNDNLVLRMPQPANPFEGDTFVSNKNYLTAYYLHLHDNMPLNVLGICGYTGISMFLSFYDSYWNDNFIPEQYDSSHSRINSSDFYSSSADKYESPGVWNNIDYSYPSVDDLKDEIMNSGITNTESTEFKEALDRKVMEQVYNQIDGGTFLGKLFEIGIENGSIKPHFVESEYHIANEGYVHGIGVNNDIMNSVLSDYINDNADLRGKVSLVTSKMNNNTDSEKNRIRSEIVEIVKTGRPVLMGGNGYTDSNGNGIQDDNEGSFGHVVVAYDYDEENDILYGNMGWSSASQAHRNLDDFFNIQMSDYWTLNISSSLPKNRTNNYIFTNKTAYYAPGLNQIYNVITPKDYGFPESYGDANTSIDKTVVLPDTGETFETNRLRCGYIEEECINISTKRYSPGLAYLEYTFDKDIYQIEVDLSWWTAYEKVYSYDSNYRIEYPVTSTAYFTVYDLWKDVNLSTNRNSPTRVVVGFPNGVRTFRFYGLASYPTNDRNKGRLSIFDMVVRYYN